MPYVESLNENYDAFFKGTAKIASEAISLPSKIALSGFDNDNDNDDGALIGNTVSENLGTIIFTTILLQTLSLPPVLFANATMAAFYLSAVASMTVTYPIAYIIDSNDDDEDDDEVMHKFKL